MDSNTSSATLVAAVAGGLSLVYLALWNKFTSVPLSAHKVTPEQASRGRIWCFLWAAVFLLVSSSWPVLKALGVQTRGEEEYKDFLSSVLDAGKSLFGALCIDALVLRALYLAVVPFCLENALANGATPPKTLSLIYFLLPLSHVGLLAGQLGLYASGGGATLNSHWREAGLISGLTTGSTAFDFAYWCANIFYGLVFAAVALVSIKGGSAFGSFGADSDPEGEGASEEQLERHRLACMKRYRSQVFAHMNVVLLAFSGWFVMANTGIPDPMKQGAYILEPALAGNRKIYTKLHDQVVIVFLYVVLAGQLYPALRRIGLFWARFSSMHNGPTFAAFFALAHLICLRKAGHTLHPSWTALENLPKTAGRALDVAFFLATVNFTVVNTNVNVFAIAGHLPKIAYKPFETCAKNIRTHLAFSGFLLIVISGMWTYAACCGLTVPIKTFGLDAKISHPPIHHCNIKTVIQVHKQDLYHGVLTAAIGVIVVSVEEYLVKNYNVGTNHLKPFASLWLKALWFYSLVSKVAVHAQVIPQCHAPIAEGSDLSLYQLANQASFASFLALRLVGAVYLFYFLFSVAMFFGEKYRTKKDD